MSFSEPLAITLLVADVLEQLEIPYFIGGSLASAIHGTARSTLDADLVVDIRPEHIPQLVSALEKDFYIDAKMKAGAIQHKSSFNIIHLATMFKIDLFVLKPRNFDQMQFQLRSIQMIGVNPEKAAYVTTPEDIILAKLEWYHLGGRVSDRQWRDILGVLKVQAGRLDTGYMRKWALLPSISNSQALVGMPPGPP